MEVKRRAELLPNIEYDKLNDIINIKGEDYKVRLTFEAQADSNGGASLFGFLVSCHSVRKQTESSREP